jgi:transcriptional regulator with XRE-family HTH domain
VGASPEPRSAAKRPAPSKAAFRKHLLETQAILGLSQNELAELLGVRQPSLAAWLAHGVPATRVASVERLYDFSKVLTAELIRERIPEIIRTPDEWLGGRSILDVIKRDGTAPIYGYLARLFSYQC